MPVAPAPLERAAEARRDAPSAVSAEPSAVPDDRKAVESAAGWLERIVRLRREGKNDEADAELKRFRERYPQSQVPTDALPPAAR